MGQGRCTGGAASRWAPIAQRKSFCTQESEVTSRAITNSDNDVPSVEKVGILLRSLRYQIHLYSRGLNNMCDCLPLLRVLASHDQRDAFLLIERARRRDMWAIYNPPGCSEWGAEES